MGIGRASSTAGVIALSVAIVGACGEAYSGTEPPPSTSTDGGPDAETGTTSVASCDALDFRRALIVATGTEPCPTGTTERFLVTGGEGTNGVCGCGTCTTTTAPSCASGTDVVVQAYGPSNACGGGDGTYVVTDDACVVVEGGNVINQISPYNSWSARAPKPGACTSEGVADATKVKPTGLRTCVPSSQADVCSAIAARRRLCTESLGGGCGGDFPLAVTGGDSIAVVCAPCGCSLVSATCNVEYHGTATCTNAKYTGILNGDCTRTNDATNISHFKFTVSPPTCSRTPGPPTVTPENPKSYCCTP